MASSESRLSDMKCFSSTQESEIQGSDPSKPTADKVPQESMYWKSHKPNSFVIPPNKIPVLSKDMHSLCLCGLTCGLPIRIN
mmetsp:Transcript_31756/g.38361  ORF Transcript_31756/g.38361 Transcript_31756/m.38361 type:complete len:82 (-) Transcript_31756:718-963(-)